MPDAYDPTATFFHLDDGPAVTVLPVTPDFWEKLVSRTDLGDGRLVSAYCFTESWDSWEMHPAGDEIVTLFSGHVDFHLEMEDGEKIVTLKDRGTVIVPRGVWHTATVHEPADMIFITRGAGTEHRPR